MRATFLHTLLLFLSLDGALSQSLSGLYWTAVQGTQQPAAAYAALSVVNASGVQIFGGATSAGPVATTLYWAGARHVWMWWRCGCWSVRVSSSAPLHHRAPHPLYLPRALPHPAASQSLVTGSALTNVPLPAYGAAVAAVPPYATAPYAAYAFGGTFSTGVTSSSWVAWDGVQWNALAVGGDSTFARVFATATYLSNCQGTGTACVFLMGGYTPGTPLSTTGLGTGVLWVPAAGPPTYQAITTLPGAGALPNPVYSHVAAAAPDGATVYVYGGIDSTGATVNSMYALNTAGWADSKVVLAELYNLAQSPDIQASSQPRTCVNSMGTVCASRNPQNLAGALSYPASVNDASSLGAGNIVGWGYRAIDGNTNGNYPSGSCTRSGSEWSSRRQARRAVPPRYTAAVDLSLAAPPPHTPPSRQLRWHPLPRALALGHALRSHGYCADPAVLAHRLLLAAHVGVRGVAGQQRRDTQRPRKLKGGQPVC